MKKFIAKEEFKARRDALASKLEEGSLILLFSGVSKLGSADETLPFEVNRNFYYLTGIDQEGSTLLIYKGDDEVKSFLFIAPYDERKEKWYGRKLTPEEAKELSDIENVLPSDSFATFIEKTLNPSKAELGLIEHLYLDEDEEQKIAEGTFLKDYKNTLTTISGGVSFKDIRPYLFTQRLVKSPSEISLLKTAIRITESAILDTYRKVHDGVKEYELADEFLRAVNDGNGYQGLSFPTIMASGVHATILHYPTPLDEAHDGDLVLMDLGARYGYYNADISRTIPVNGKFNELQRKIYDIVLRANKLVISLARPSISIKELNDAVKDFMAVECLKEGLIKTKEEIERVYFHSVSHFIGLNTHDPYMDLEKKAYREIPLVEGAVISDEPGLYFPEHKIGVRIEDDLYITESGCINLSSGIIKEIEDIESLLASFKK